MKAALLILAMVLLVGCALEPKVVPNGPEPEAAFQFDPNDKNHVIIEAAIRKATNKPEGELTKQDFEKVKSLSFRGKQLTDVSALEGLTLLTKLDLRSNKLTDLKGLEGLKQLKELSLQNGNQLTDVSALAELTKLEWLNLYGNQLTDVSPLTGLKQLKTLNLRSNKITVDQLKHLARPAKLESLDLRENKLTDISPLGELKQLETLLLSGNRLTDLSPLSGLKKLGYLHIYNVPNLTKTEIAKIQKALPKCKIEHDPKK